MVSSAGVYVCPAQSCWGAVLFGHQHTGKSLVCLGRVRTIYLSCWQASTAELVNPSSFGWQQRVYEPFCGCLLLVMHMIDQFWGVVPVRQRWHCLLGGDCYLAVPAGLLVCGFDGCGGCENAMPCNSGFRRNGALSVASWHWCSMLHRVADGMLCACANWPSGLDACKRMLGASCLGR